MEPSNTNTNQNSLNIDTYQFFDTSFNLLMQKRIRKVMLICSSYDFFLLEEDGRIDEQIFIEYASLNLSNAPGFVHADSALEAFKILETDEIDLIIEMLSLGELNPFNLAKDIKNKYPQIPIVILTPFSREVSLTLYHEDHSAIDHIFCWLGNADLLLAIIKLLEDTMNAEHDIDNVGVQTILYIEDSIRYASGLLPNLYKLVMKQSRELMKEGLNEHQKTIRMRGRPKILMATTYDEALDLYMKYKNNLIGIISDVSYKIAPNKRDTVAKAGLKFCEMVRQEDIYLPILLQSSDNSNSDTAKTLNAGFVDKHSKNIYHEIENYIVKNFAFGAFIFRNPKTQKAEYSAKDLRDLQEKLLIIPDPILEYHARRDDFSKWLNARALFPLARMFKAAKRDDFGTTEEVRNYLYNSISKFRMVEGHGIIAQFEKSRFDEYMLLSRIGEGSLGGKGRGLAFIDTVLKKYEIERQFDGVKVTIPRTVVLSTDIFEEFMESNTLYPKAMSLNSDEDVLNLFVASKLPDSIIDDLKAFISQTTKPIAIRSSSKLEDSYYQPFAGVYSTYMIPNLIDDDKTLEMLSIAIKSVYASVFYRTSKAYISATSNVIDEEKMGIILQEVCGTAVEGTYFPTISGVARSINFYPIEPEKSKDGIAKIAFGLGKLVVDGGIGLRFSPKYPKKIIQLSSPEFAIRDTQKHYYALDLSPESFKISIDDTANIQKRSIRSAPISSSFMQVCSTYDPENNIVRDGNHTTGLKIVSFSNILTHNTFPLAKILETLLMVGQKEMGKPIEIEFAANLDVPEGALKEFYFLQIRPIVENEPLNSIDLEDIDVSSTILYSKKALGNGSFEDLKDIVYIKTEGFDPKYTNQIATSLEQINNSFIEQRKNYILIGPGRWGTSDPWLGIPIKWAQISNARVIVEAGLDNFRIDPSQGTHFFQNITSFQVGYFTVNPSAGDGHYDIKYLDGLKAVYEDDLIRHVCFHDNLKVQIDGKHNNGVIYKENIK